MLESKKTKYEIVEELSSKYPLKYLYELTGISRSGYYSYLKRDKTKDQWLKEKIIEVYKRNKGRYGYRRITAALNKECRKPVNHKKVLWLMRQLNLKAKIWLKRKYYSKESSQAVIRPNIFNREFAAERMNQKWVTDITYLVYGNQRVYLSVIVDLFNLGVIAYNFSRNNDNILVIEILKRAFNRTKTLENIILHSDQGAQNTSRPYANILSEHGIKQSMSNRGNCLDNAPVNAFFLI